MRKLLAVLLAFLLSAFGQKSPSSTSPRTCQEPQGLPGGKLLLFGEMHGSVEAPGLISELACALSGTQEIAVGLEMPTQDQPLIDAYLKSRGTKADVAALTSSDFWQKGRDGRSSQAMLELVEDIRALRADGKTVDLFVFDDQPGTNLERNVAIANGIRRYRVAHPSVQIIALMGNIHAMRSEIHIDGRILTPSGSLLGDLNPVSISIAYPAGTIWACMPACGIQNLTSTNPATVSPGFKEGASLGGYNYSFLLSSITASPPAVRE
jgi:hypothetical protein